MLCLGVWCQGDLVRTASDLSGYRESQLEARRARLERATRGAAGDVAEDDEIGVFDECDSKSDSAHSGPRGTCHKRIDSYGLDLDEFMQKSARTPCCLKKQYFWLLFVAIPEQC